MELRILLRNGFDYDLWANRAWLDAIGGFSGYLNRAQETLEHILTAQQIWLDRCGATMFPEQENVRLQDLFEITARAWQVMLEELQGDEPITYTTKSGEVYTNTIAQIAYHVLNHGTYHRGQLRGFAEADGFENFPETDLILFLRKRDRQ